MKAIFTIFTLVVTVLLLSARLVDQPRQAMAQVALEDVRNHTRLFAESTVALERVLITVDAGHPATITAARNALKSSRYRYKGIEYFMSYFFKSAARIYNAPAKIEVEEPELEYEEPVGLQLIESLLYKPVTTHSKHQLLEQASAVRSSAQDIASLFYQFETTDDQVMESIRQELIRIETLNITGFDAPLLKSGITESANAIRAVGAVLAVRKDKVIDKLVSSAIIYLNAHPDFDKFDRLHFITTFISPLQKRIGVDLFNRKFLNTQSFYPQQFPSNKAMIELGKKLFFEKAISGNGLRSCASCHQPEKYFTDGLSRSPTLDGHGSVPRNTPTLLYAAFQYSQDWDGKARSIEEQVLNVMNNKDEMAADSAEVIIKLNRNTAYLKLFSRAFSGKSTVSINNLSTAIAAYIRTLAPFTSPFDRYMRGDRKAMNAVQIRGFNLFMGKAQCGSCHFMPVFNGLTPPEYKATEYEILGVSLTDNLQQPESDPDLGRFTSYQTKYYRSAFKTPTLRNVSKTAPYMHNGGFRTLEKVMEFYNKGGGKGIGLNVPEQTLSSGELQLTPIEIKAVINFLETLNDNP